MNLVVGVLNGGLATKRISYLWSTQLQDVQPWTRPLPTQGILDDIP